MKYLIDRIERLRTYPTDQELVLTKEIIEEIEDFDLVEKVNRAIGWCNANIDDESECATFATQIRDCLESSLVK